MVSLIFTCTAMFTDRKMNRWKKYTTGKCYIHQNNTITSVLGIDNYTLAMNKDFLHIKANRNIDFTQMMKCQCNKTDISSRYHHVGKFVVTISILWERKTLGWRSYVLLMQDCRVTWMLFVKLIVTIIGDKSNEWISAKCVIALTVDSFIFCTLSLLWYGI